MMEILAVANTILLTLLVIINAFGFNSLKNEVSKLRNQSQAENDHILNRLDKIVRHIKGDDLPPIDHTKDMTSKARRIA